MNEKQKGLFDDLAPWEEDDRPMVDVATIVYSMPPFGPFDYLIPELLRSRLQPGMRVRAPLGAGNRMLIGYCTEVRQIPDSRRRLKTISSIVDSEPLLSPRLLHLTKWISDYYLTPLGTVIEAVVPAGVRGMAGTRDTTFLAVPTSVAARLTQLKLPKKQAQALHVLANSLEPLTPQELATAAKCTMSPIQELRKKKLVTETSRRVQRFAPDETVVEREQPHELNDEQSSALEKITDSLTQTESTVFVMHGVTGSGKTEVYIRAIAEAIRIGRQAIVLVPEISLTPQTCQRFRSRFDNVAVLHSHLTDSERNWHWKRIANGSVQVIVGARSAIFAPARNLGIIIIDEEHDFSFKQDRAPRYHAREVAAERARMEKIPLVLGTATPSLESWQRTQSGQYKLISMPKRVLDLPLPHVAAIDMRNERPGSGRRSVSQPLYQAIKQTLTEKGQVILLLNRRGFATSIQCPGCGEVLKCEQCDISLTHHREDSRALCHYCDYEIATPRRCKACGFDGINLGGVGTQRLEEEVRKLFPEALCLRMDSDTMRKPGSHEETLRRFRKGEAEILLGTQMIAKGLDFPNVTLVGVVNADTALHLPDFRAAERTFQLVTQVAGRTGRGARGGRVMVQTYNPEHASLQAALRHDYIGFAELEIPQREAFGYPPHTSMARIVIRSESELLTEQFSEQISDLVQKKLAHDQPNVRFLGPAPAPVSKLRGRFRMHALIMANDLSEIRQLVQYLQDKTKAPSDVEWIADIDPVDML